jgi:hypothetical protein
VGRDRSDLVALAGAPLGLVDALAGPAPMNRLGRQRPRLGGGSPGIVAADAEAFPRMSATTPFTSKIEVALGDP